MAQIFHRSANTLACVSILGVVVLLAGLGAIISEVQRSAHVTRQDEARVQNPPFSHEHHVAGLGLDCRYCHTSVETSSFAGMPPTATCMNCHKLIWADSDMLEPVRASLRDDRPIVWTRVHDLPDFAYFDHSIHVAKGIGCVSCHGRVDQMPLMRQAAPLQMEWCLECHRHPEAQVRPRSEVFNLNWAAADQASLGPRLVKEYGIRSVRDLTSCSTCHR